MITSSSEMKEIYLSECMEQPQCLNELFRAYSTDREIRIELEHVKDNVTPSKALVWLGMGASYCSSISGATRLSLSGRPSYCVEASEWLHFALSTWEHISGPILITTSGESAEMLDLCRQPGRHPRILICNSPESSCWKAAEVRLPIMVESEQGNATKTYTNCSAICTLLASELLGLPWQQEAPRVSEAFAQSLELAFSRRSEVEEFCRGMETLEILGRGPALGGAMMGALCLREMVTWRANAHSGGSFRHGPFLDVDSTHIAMILALGSTAELGRRMAEDCITKGGKVMLVVDREPVDGAI